MKYKELVYLCLDEIKGISDDFIFTEEHIIVLLNKYRLFLLEKKYERENEKKREEVPDSNYQTICLTLEQTTLPDCCGETYLRSKEEVPSTSGIGNVKVYPVNSYQDIITFISSDRMKFVGHNKYLQNIIYCSIADDNHLYFKSANPQFLYLESIKMSAVFEDPEEAEELSCDKDGKECDILDRDFPMENDLIAPMIELIVKNLTGVEFIREDKTNNAKDDIPTENTTRTK